MRFRRFLVPGVAAFLLGCSGGYDVVITGGRVMDPASGLDAVRHVGIRGGKIVTITEDEITGDRLIDATGLVVAPGFVDLHEHGITESAYGFMVRDGVTSAFELEVGTGNVAEWYADRGEGQIVNFGVSIGHIPVRMIVMDDPGDYLPAGAGGNGVASEEQVAKIVRRIEEGLEQGAVAVGFGWAYTPVATAAEIGAAMSVAAARGATAHMHTKSGINGVTEALQTAADAGVRFHIVHANSTGGAAIAEVLELIGAAREAGQDVTTEAYPYGAGSTRIESALYDNWESWDDERFQRIQWVATGERLTRETFGRYRAQGGALISHTRTEEMTRTAIASPLTMIASDGGLRELKGHPRSTGTYAKVLGRYVREEGVVDLMDALRRMTVEPASRLEAYAPQMESKGRLQEGFDADITIFDPETVIDRSTYMEPAIPSAGIPFVLVNGVVVVDGGELVEGVTPGVPVKGRG